MTEIPVPTLDDLITAAKAGKVEAHIGLYENPWRPVEICEDGCRYRPGTVQLTEKDLRVGRLQYRQWDGTQKLVFRFRSGMVQPVRICE